MSSTVMVSFEGSGAVPYSTANGPEDADYGNVLGLLGSRLDELAGRLGIRPLGDFHYADPEMLLEIASELEGRAKENVERLLASQQEWHQVDAGRQTVARLLEHLGGLDEATASEQHAVLLLGGRLEPLLSDLRALERTLAGSDARFHLESL